MSLPSILVFRWIDISLPERGHAKLLAYCDDGDIATIYVGNATYHKHLADAIEDDLGDQELIATADVGKDGEVTGWKSSGFSFETPEELRDPIASFLEQHRSDIEDRWAS